MKWERKTLGNLCFIGRGSSPRPIANSAYFIGGTIPWIKIADATSSTKYILETKEHVNDYGASFSRKLQAGSLILAASGTLGFPMFLGVEGCIHDGWLYFDDLKEIDKYFLYYKLITLREYFNGRASGAAIQNINTGILKEVEIEIPPLPTQRKIASILSAYDDLIENNLKRIKLLEEKAFVTYKGIVSSEKLEKHILSDFGEIITGKTPSTTIADYFGDDVPFIKTPDMHSQIFIEHTSQNLSELGAKSQEKKFLPPLSLCVSCIGTAGVVGITSKPSQTNQQINSILFFNKKHIYYFYALMSQMKEQLDALGSNGSTFTNVNKNKFENMEVFIPNQRVLKEFADEFETPFNLILTLQKQNTKLREARDILLPRLMNGQIEVS